MSPDAAPITMWWIGQSPANESMLESVRTHVGDVYAAPVSLLDPGERPQNTFDVRRQQHASRELLRWLVDRSGGANGRLLGLTDVDLFIPILTFVFGEAQLNGPAAVVSTARLLHATQSEVTTSRLKREAVHELGHTFGLLHCDAVEGAGSRARPCVMARSASVRAVDVKSNRLCDDCRARYVLLQQDGSHVYREYENPHR